MSYVVADFPAPVQGAEEVSQMAAPSAVAAAWTSMIDGGWDVRCTRALGYIPDGNGEPKKEKVRHFFEEDAENPNAKKSEWRETGALVLVESYALRASKDGVGLVAVWHFERDKVKKRTTDSKKGEWRKGDEYLADVCTLDMAMTTSGLRFRNVTELKAFLA